MNLNDLTNSADRPRSKAIALLFVAAALCAVGSCADAVDEVLEVPVRTCADGGNLVANCSFDRDLSSWESVLGPEYADHVANDGLHGRGCAELSPAQVPSGYAQIQQCIVPETWADYDVSIGFRVSQGAPDSCSLFAVPTLDLGCRNASGSVLVDSELPLSSSWSMSDTATFEWIIGGDTWSALRVGVSCSGVDAFKVRIDDVVVRPSRQRRIR